MGTSPNSSPGNAVKSMRPLEQSGTVFPLPLDAMGTISGTAPNAPNALTVLRRTRLRKELMLRGRQSERQMTDSHPEVWVKSPLKPVLLLNFATLLYEPIPFRAGQLKLFFWCLHLKRIMLQSPLTEYTNNKRKYRYYKRLVSNFASSRPWQNRC